MKYTKVKFNEKRITRLFQDGKCVAEIARMIGYPTGHGNNRVRGCLTKAGLYAVSCGKNPARRKKETK